LDREFSGKPDAGNPLVRFEEGRGCGPAYSTSIKFCVPRLTQPWHIVLQRSARIVHGSFGEVLEVVSMFFGIVGTITETETIVRGTGVVSRSRPRKRYGGGAWRKLKGVARVRFADGTARQAEVL
jgi:hypothetical protein